MSVVIGDAEYPEGVVEAIKTAGVEIHTLDALSMAVSAGNPKSANVVLIGAMAKTTDIEKEIWLEALKQNVPEKFLEVNLKAFEAGYNS